MFPIGHLLTIIISLTLQMRSAGAGWGGVGGGARGYLEPARRGQCHPESTHFNKHQHTDTANIANISFTLQDL